MRRFIKVGFSLIDMQLYKAEQWNYQYIGADVLWCCLETFLEFVWTWAFRRFYSFRQYLSGFFFFLISAWSKCYAEHAIHSRCVSVQYVVFLVEMNSCMSNVIINFIILIFNNCHIVLVTPDCRKCPMECTCLVVFRCTSAAVKWSGDVHMWCTLSFCAYTLQVLFKVVALLPSVLWCFLAAAAQMGSGHAFVCPPAVSELAAAAKKLNKAVHALLKQLPAEKQSHQTCIMYITYKWERKSAGRDCNVGMYACVFVCSAFFFVI